MEESNDVQALEKICSEVDESQIKVILSSQCIKAQAFLLDKLKKQAERHKDTCNYISSANLKLEAEIKQAEQEIRSMLIAQETLKSANVEIKKEWLLAKAGKADIIERITYGKNKYGALWQECKARYESIPFVQKLLKATERQKKTEQDILDLDKILSNLYDEMDTRRKHCVEVDKNRCIELANYMMKDMPQNMNILKEKADIIKNLTKEIELLKEQHNNVEAVLIPDIMETSIKNINDNVEVAALDLQGFSKSHEDILIPKLNLMNFDHDIIGVNLDKVRKTRDQINNIPTTTNPVINKIENIIEQSHENEKTYDYIISPYFKPYKEKTPRNFSERKLINILEDININDGEAYSIVKKLNPEQLRTVDEISAEVVENSKVTPSFSTNKDDKPIVSQDIEEIDLTSCNAENILIPPTQFLDVTLSDEPPKKRVSFDLPSSSSVQINEIIDGDKAEDYVNEEGNQTQNSQLDVSAGSDESFIKIREMLLKKHNLDLSPQFVYAKNNVLQKVQKEDDHIVTSKFFHTHNSESNKTEEQTNKMEVDNQADDEEINETFNSENVEHEAATQKEPKQNVILMDIDDINVSSPKPNKASTEQKSERQVTGLLFTHGGQGIPDSLNVSLSTTGFEDSEFPHCIDSSLLLSPKADIPATNDNHVLSQEVPNFLSGFRKTGFSFFGGITSSEQKPDSSVEKETNNNNTFNFNFGGEKKNRGGLFSLFN